MCQGLSHDALEVKKVPRVLQIICTVFSVCWHKYSCVFIATAYNMLGPKQQSTEVKFSDW